MPHSEIHSELISILEQIRGMSEYDTRAYLVDALSQVKQQGIKRHRTHITIDLGYIVDHFAYVEQLPILIERAKDIAPPGIGAKLDEILVKLKSEQQQYDVFICHASEDKGDFVDPLAEMLSEVGVRVWYDKFTLEWGDTLPQSIDKGLARSRYGIVVLSKSFFREGKYWTQYELERLWGREIGGRKVILPIWHKITKDEIKSFAPTLVNKIALDTSKCTLDEIVHTVIEMLQSDS